MKKLLFIILSIAVICGAFYSVQSFSNSNSNTSGVKINENAVKIKAADFRLKDLDGKEVSLSDFRGKNVYLNFWATWCPPCKAEMPDIEKLYDETKDSNLVILAVNLGEGSSTVKTFVDNNKYNFRILLDTDKDAAAKYNISAIPSSFFIDKNGNIISKKIGTMTLEEMKAYVKGLGK
jgi:thiol-disulfide isomerase/thioredoxin